ncbi:unnamed protein product [Brassica oleracea]
MKLYMENAKFVERGYQLCKESTTFTLVHPKAHEHSLTLMPQRSFVCNACEMDDDPNPYVWDGIELEGISDKILEVKSYEMIEEGVIKHSGHADHTLKLKEESDTNDKWMWCKACLNPIFFSPFYSCMKCDDFILHKKCAFLPTKKIDSFYKTLVTLITTPDSSDTIFVCNACQYVFQGFHYKSDDGNIFLDVEIDGWNEFDKEYAFVYANPKIGSKRILVKCLAMGDKHLVAIDDGGAEPAHLDNNQNMHFFAKTEKHIFPPKPKDAFFRKNI